MRTEDGSKDKNFTRCLRDTPALEGLSDILHDDPPRLYPFGGSAENLEHQVFS